MDRETTGKREGVGDVITEVHSALRTEIHSALRELELRPLNIHARFLDLDDLELIADALRDRPPTQWAYDLAWNALNKKFDELHQASGACEALRLELNTARREVFLEKDVEKLLNDITAISPWESSGALWAARIKALHNLLRDRRQHAAKEDSEGNG